MFPRRESRGARLASEQTLGAPHILQRLLINGGAAINLVFATMESPPWPAMAVRPDAGHPDVRLEPEANPPPEFGHADHTWLGQALKLLLGDAGR